MWRMSTKSSAIAAMLIALAGIAPAAADPANDPACTVTAGEATAEALVTRAEAMQRGRCGGVPPQEVERLLRQAIGAEGGETARARAFRMLVDLHAATGRDPARLESILQDGRQGDAWTHARAWLRFRQGRFADAAALLEPLVRPRHHTLPRWAIVHEDLGDSYAALGRDAEAEGQWRVALATESGPDGSGWDRQALEAKLADAAANGGAQPLVPVLSYPDARYAIDLASIRPTEAGVRYQKLELLKENEAGAAYSRFTREIDCDEPRTRLLALQRYDVGGMPVPVEAPSADWQPIRYDDPWMHTEQRLVCGFDRETPLRSAREGDAERLRAYREAGGN